MAAIGKSLKYISDLQILEFNEEMDSEENMIVSIPWCQYIVVAVSEDGGAILDLRKSDPIVRCPKGIHFVEDYRGMIVVATNIHRKQLLVSKRGLTEGEEGDDGPYKHTLCIYNVSDDGKVDLVKQIDTKNTESPKTAYMRDNNRKVLKFIEHQGTIKFVILGLTSDEDVGEEYENEHMPITFLYDTKTRQHHKLEIELDYWERKYNVTYINDSLQFIEDDADFTGSFSLDPIIQHQKGYEYFIKERYILSPDGNRLLEYKIDKLDVQISLKDKSDTRSDTRFGGNKQDYHTIAQSNILFFNEEPKDERELEVEVVPEVIKKKRRKKKSIIGTHKKKQRPKPPVEAITEVNWRSINLHFFWLSNDIIVATYRSRIAILDFRYTPPEEGFKSFELPLYGVGSHLARLTDTSFVMMHTTKTGVVLVKLTV